MKYRIAAAVLCTLATIRVIADLTGLQALGAAAAVTNAAPAMKVFTAQQGYETYSSQFELEFVYKSGRTITILLDPEKYSRLDGPYNRRNVYGALIAYGPVLVANPRTQPMWQAMAYRGFCIRPDVVEELTDIEDERLARATVRYLGQVQTRSGYTDSLAVTCD